MNYADAGGIPSDRPYPTSNANLYAHNAEDAYEARIVADHTQHLGLHERRRLHPLERRAHMRS